MNKKDKNEIKKRTNDKLFLKIKLKDKKCNYFFLDKITRKVLRYLGF